MKLIPGTFTESYQERIIKQAIDEHFRIEERNFLRKNGAPKLKLYRYFLLIALIVMAEESQMELDVKKAG